MMPWLILTFLATACAPLTTTYPPTGIVIDVRDSQTHSPIHGAMVVGSTNVFYYPVMEDNMFGRGGVIPSFVAVNQPDGWQIETDASGMAHTMTGGGSPTSFAIIASGYATTHGRFESHPSGWPIGAQQWSLGRRVDGQPTLHTLEFRVRSHQAAAVQGPQQ